MKYHWLRTTLKLVLIALVFVLPQASMATEGEYPRVEERAKALATLADVKSSQSRLELGNLEQRPQKEKAFLQYFAQSLFPLMDEMRKLASVHAILRVSLDRALYDSEDEKNVWLKESQEAELASSKISTSKEWKEALREWALLAGDLQGELPDMARQLFEADELSGFAAEQMPLVEKSSQLDSVISQKSNESRVTGKDLADYQKGMDEIEKIYRRGEITFQEATARIDQIWTKGFHAKGDDVAQSAGAELDELAIVRTQLAKSKGFSNWADYRLSTAKFTHAPGFQTVDDHIRFFTEVLEKTLPAHNRYKEWVENQNPNIPKEQIDNRNSHLLAPETETMIAEYFPVENVNQFWIQTMRESGFSQSAIDHINLDSFPRDNKQTHAYMWPAVMPRPQVIRINGLDFEIPAVGDSHWYSPTIYIVQNARKDGIDAYSTVFHEGGHGLDFAQRLSVIEMGESYAYSETASMTMERFFADRDFLMAKGKTREGEPLPLEKAQAYINNSAMVDAISTRAQVFNALFDILIWKQAYESGSDGFVEKTLQIYDELRAKYFPGNTVLPPGVRAGTRMFSTSHFYSGEVRYYGYIYADMVSQMTADFMWDHFELETGRRSFLNQSQMAKILVQGQYQRGFSLPFPKATERLTGKSFDPAFLIEHINRSVPEGSSCDQLMR